MSLHTVTATRVLGALALLLVAAAAWLLLLGPARADLAEARQEVVATADANALRTVQLAGLEQQAGDLGAVDDVADDLATLFPPTADQPGFFEMVDAAAAAAGIAPGKVTALSPGLPTAPVEQDPATVRLAEQSVTLDVEADERSLRRLLAELESMDRSFLVRSVTLTASSEAGAGAARASIQGSTFVAAPVERPRGAGADVGAGTDQPGAGGGDSTDGR